VKELFMSERTFSASGVPVQTGGRHSETVTTHDPSMAYSPAVSDTAGGMQTGPRSMAAVPVLVTGLWVAISPWVCNFGGGNRTQVNDLIVGLAIAVAALASLTAVRGVTELGVVQAIGGIWLIVSAFILAAHTTAGTGWYWSNIIAGIVAIVFGGAAAAPMSRKA
jgi:hypothetical protein